jgi:phosphatidylserine/phosphatidylglycerophosphate/cardiolipin synthase-like enzyme
MPHPFQAVGEGVTARSWLSLLNFKANHRKLVVTDAATEQGERKVVSLVTSANPHDGSSAHSNVAVRVDDSLWQDIVASEQAVGNWSGKRIAGVEGKVDDQQGQVKVQMLTEGAIREKIVELLEEAQAGDEIDLAMFYLSERSVIDSLVKASERGAAVRLVLDPNKDAFGHTKNGVPNRPVATELISKTDGNIKVRWCDTHGEQCHTKLVLLSLGDRRVMVLGSANLTRRNIADYNLETDVLVSSSEENEALSAAGEYFEEIWTNGSDKVFTADYGVYGEDSWYKKVMYRVQESTGLSSF